MYNVGCSLWRWLDMFHGSGMVYTVGYDIPDFPFMYRKPRRVVFLDSIIFLERQLRTGLIMRHL